MRSAYGWRLKGQISRDMGWGLEGGTKSNMSTTMGGGRDQKKMAITSMLLELSLIDLKRGTGTKNNMRSAYGRESKTKT